MSHASIIKCPRVFIDPGNSYPVTTTLQSAISNTQDNDFTITVLDTTDFKESGYITINQEIFYYSSKSKTELFNVYRALKNTSRRDHIINSTVQQINESINKLVTDDKLAGWYVDGYSNQASLRVQDSPVIQPGVIRYIEDTTNPSNSKFQGCLSFDSSGPIWQDFNARKGDKGDEGDINTALKFVHVSNNLTDNDLNSGAIIKSTDINTIDSNQINVRRIISGTRKINFEDTNTVDIETTNNSIIINPKPQPNIESLLEPITTLKGTEGNKCYGDIQKVYVKPGTKVETGQVTRYSIYNFNNNYYIVVEPYTYSSTEEENLSKYDTDSNNSSREIAGIALETYDATSTFDSLKSIQICTKGICQIKISSNGQNPTTRNVVYIGKPCIMSYNGFGLCNTSNDKPNLNYIELGGFMESYNGDENNEDFAVPGTYVLINFNPKYIENDIST